MGNVKEPPRLRRLVKIPVAVDLCGEGRGCVLFFLYLNPHPLVEAERDELGRRTGDPTIQVGLTRVAGVLVLPVKLFA